MEFLKGSTLFLKLAVIIIGIPVLIISIIGLAWLKGHPCPEYAIYYTYYNRYLSFGSSIFTALFQTFKRLTCIDKNKHSHNWPFSH